MVSMESLVYSIKINIMFKSKQILFALGMTTIFLLLTIFAVLSYNGDEDNSRAYQLAINQKTYIFLEIGRASCRERV